MERELIINKAIADTSQTWDIHHRLELTLDGEFAHSKAELIRLGMYFQRPYFELIFLTHTEHQRLHMQSLSAETLKKMSEASKGENNSMYGKHLSADARQKISVANKGKHVGAANGFYGKTHSVEIIQRLSEVNKGVNNPMYGKQHTTESLHKMKELMNARKNAYRQYKSNGGKLKWHEWLNFAKTGTFPSPIDPIPQNQQVANVNGLV